MIINSKCQNGVLELEFTPEEDDSVIQHVFSNIFKRTHIVEMASNQCEIHLPSDWTIDAVHPDVFALAIMSIIYPFCGSTIRLPQGVSKHFHDQVVQLTDIKVLPVNDNLSPRTAPSNAVPALSYSGGVDSTAAVVLLPADTHLFYIDRMFPKGVKPQLNQEAAYYACDSMAEMGKNAHKIKTDLAFVRKPVGFSTFLSDAVPALLLADYYGFDSIANGHTLEEGYQIGHLGYKDCRDTKIGKPWQSLLESIDMPYTLPTVGLSEPSTTRIVMESPYHEFAQSCVRGQVKQPCMNCYHCFRKNLLEKVLSNSPLEDHYLDKLFYIKGVKNILKTPHLHYGNVLSFITANYNGSHKEMLELKEKTRGDILDVDWMRKWFPKSQEFLAPKYRNDVIKNIHKYVEPMNAEDIKTMKRSFSEEFFRKR